MSKPTPGPWEWIGRDLEGPESRTVMETETECGQFCQGGWPKITISDADRALIADAPALLDALEGLVRINEEHNAAVAAVIGNPPGWKDDYLDTARALLRKHGRLNSEETHG